MERRVVAFLLFSIFLFSDFPVRGLSKFSQCRSLVFSLSQPGVVRSNARTPLSIHRLAHKSAIGLKFRHLIYSVIATYYNVVGNVYFFIDVHILNKSKKGCNTFSLLDSTLPDIIFIYICSRSYESHSVR